MHLTEMSMEQLLTREGIRCCACGRTHHCGVEEVILGSGAVNQTAEVLARHGIHHPFIVCDENTRKAAMAQVEFSLIQKGMTYEVFSLGDGHIEPDERAVGALTMAFPAGCDGILAVGSGVINDCCKVLVHAVGRRSVAVGTAPSMDGYASNSASMIQNGVKLSLYTGSPVAVIADTAIMKDAPMRMLQAGYGDMIAKYCALCEWRIANLVTGEPYCEEIADMMRKVLRQVCEGADQLAQRDEDAVGKVVSGLILSGIAMSFAEVSRPASGVEHYFSHMWEMMDLERGYPSELHGIQVGVGTILTLRVLEWMRCQTPAREHAEKAYAAFSQESWLVEIQRIFGKAAPAILKGEEAWEKNAPEAHRGRLDRLLAHWDKILSIMEEELPDKEVLLAQMNHLQMPTTPEDLGISPKDVVDAWIGSREIRPKYLCSSICWDLGWLREAADLL